MKQKLFDLFLSIVLVLVVIQFVGYVQAYAKDKGNQCARINTGAIRNVNNHI